MAPIVIAHHLIWTAYGTWLPNDPRGSGSHRVACDVLAQIGELHHGRKRMQPAGQQIAEFYRKATPLLQHPVMPLDVRSRNVVAEAFAQVIDESKYTCYACAIMPDHVHILIRKHRDTAEQMLDHLRATSRLRLSTNHHFPSDHPVWTTGGGWKVFLDHPDDIRRTIGYINTNPAQAGLPPQRWNFVKPYDGWPLHPGHRANSPYVKRLRAAGRYP